MTKLLLLGTPRRYIQLPFFLSPQTHMARDNYFVTGICATQEVFA